MKIVKNYLWNSLYQLVSVLTPLLTVPYVSHVLGPTGIGINAYTNSIVQYFILLGGIGLDRYGNRQIAYVRDDEKKLTQTFWELTEIRLCTFAVAILAYILFIFTTDKYNGYYFGQLFLLIGAAIDLSWYFQGLEQFKITVVRSLIVKVISLALIFAFVKHQNDVGLYILIQSSAQLIGVLLLWPSALRSLTTKRKKTHNLFHHLRESIKLFIPQVAVQLYLQLNKTMLGLIIGVTAAGFYDSSDKIVKILLSFVTATGVVLLPKVANDFSKGDAEAISNSLNRSMHFNLALALPLCFGLIAVSKSFVVLFFGDGFEPVGKLMAIEAIVTVPISVGNVTGLQFLMPTNRLRPYTISVFLGAGVNVLLNVPFILFWGVDGAMIATLISEICVAAFQLFSIRTLINLRRLFAESWKYLIAAIIMCVCVHIMTVYLSASVMSLVIEFFTGTLVYLALLVSFRPKTLVEMIKEIRR